MINAFGYIRSLLVYDLTLPTGLRNSTDYAVFREIGKRNKMDRVHKEADEILKEFRQNLTPRG